MPEYKNENSSTFSRQSLSHTIYCSAFGFTLLEIMIALAIIGTALTVIIHTVNFHAGIMDENILTTKMYQMAKEKMRELEALPQNSEGGTATMGLEYVNSVLPIEDSDVVKLTTVVRGYGKQVMLDQLIIKKNSSR